MLTYPKQKTYYLASLAILPKYQHKGLGKILFNIYLTYKQKYSKLQLHTNNPPMLHLTTTAGFIKKRTNKKYFGTDTYYLMELKR